MTYNPYSQVPPITPSTTFASAVANIPIVADYRFGFSVVASGTQIAITNTTTLAQYFNPYGDVANFSGTPIKINSELQQYNTAFSTVNYALNSGSLSLTGALNVGGTVAPTVSGSLGNNPAFSTASFVSGNLGLTSIAGLTVGQMMVLTFFGIYAITGITGSGGSATITTTALFASPTSISAGAFTPYAFMPWYYALANTSSIVGQNQISVPLLSSASLTGMFVGLYNNTANTNQANNAMNATINYQVQMQSGTLITLAQNLVDSVNQNQGVFFTPPITSAQLWTKTNYAPPGQGCTYLAADALIQLPQNAVGYTGGYATAVPNGSYGAWPAFWMYGGSGSGFADASEIDNIETYNNIVFNTSAANINVRFADPTVYTETANYLYDPSLWDLVAPNYIYNSATNYGQAFSHWQVLQTPDMVHTFIDGVLIKSTPYVWTSTRSPQFILNLAIGSLSAGLGTNNLYPISTTNFTSMRFNVQRLQIRQL